MNKINIPWSKSNQFSTDTPACKIPGHHFHAFAKNVWKPQVWSVSLSQNTPKIRKSTEDEQNLISSEGGQGSRYFSIPNFSHAFSRKCLESLNFTCFTKSKCHQTRKIHRRWPKSDQFWRYLGYIHRPNFRPFLRSIHKKCPETTNLIRFTNSKYCQHEENQQTIPEIWFIIPKAGQILGHSFHVFFREWPVSLNQMLLKWEKSTNHDQNVICSEGCHETSACQISGHSYHTFSQKCLKTANFSCFTRFFSLCDLPIWQVTFIPNQPIMERRLHGIITTMMP